jgi:16S rRNA C967 or C1407 C5-methylase (RsmB/RsmF family)
MIEYSTCTLNKDENEGVIEEVIRSFNGSSDEEDAQNQGLLSIVEMHTILPYNNSVGFFYCILRKMAE